MKIPKPSIVIGAVSSGPDPVSPGNFTCDALYITNDTGFDLEYRRNGEGLFFPILSGSSIKIIGISNAIQIHIRRIDLGDAVTIKYEAITL